MFNLRDYEVFSVLVPHEAVTKLNTFSCD